MASQGCAEAQGSGWPPHPPESWKTPVQWKVGPAGYISSKKRPFSILIFFFKAHEVVSRNVESVDPVLRGLYWNRAVRKNTHT